MSRLLIIVQRVDENDDHRAFLIGWLKEFAKAFDEVSVITLAGGVYTLPPNIRVYSLGKERGASKLMQAFRFYRYLFRLLPGASGIFAHASPIFILASWPLAFLYRKKLVLWYLHRAVPPKFRLAVLLSTWVVTADAASLAIKNRKVISVGHGIDVAHFAVARDWSAIAQHPLRVVSVGRLSPIKDFATLIRAAALLRDRQVLIEVRIVGRAVMPSDFAYQHELQDLAARLGVQDIVHFAGFVSYKDIAEQYFWADVAVGCTPRGGIDKVLLEAMAAGCPVFTSNSVMRQYVEPYADQLVFEHSNPEDLAAKIEGLDDQPAVSTAMVANVRRDHDLSATITKIAKLL